MKERWANPELAARMRAGLAKGHRTIAARLEGTGGDAGEGGGSDPPEGGAGSEGHRGEAARVSVLTASPRDLWDRLTGR